MRPPLLSPDWYRVAGLRPRLRPGVTVVRQWVRGERWYVLSDPVSGRHLRFNANAFALVQACNGENTLDTIWAARVASAGDDAPTQADTIALLSQAFGANLLVADVSADAAGLLRRHQQARRQRWRERVNPLSFRVPLWDADAWLARLAPAARQLVHPSLGWLLAALLTASVMLLLVQADALAATVRQQLGQGRMLLLVWLVFPLVKALHELAHALAVKVQGGAVHEVGLSLMMLNPVPYVDASAANAFAGKHQRAAVAGAGIVVELLLAGVALLLWTLLEPSLARDTALAVVVVGALSTLLVNGNPLLPLDGYHVLCDLAELPNLATRSRAYWLWLVKRQVLGLRHLAFGGLAAGERRWLLAYAPLAWAWRLALLVAMGLALAQWSSTLGLLCLAWGLWLAVGRGLWSALRWLRISPELAGHRGRALVMVLALATAGVVGLFGLPVADTTRAPGVVWLPDDAEQRSSEEGTLEAYLQQDGDAVAEGQPIARLANPPLVLAHAQVVRQLEQQRINRLLAFERDAQGVAAAEDEIRRLEAQAAQLALRLAGMTVRARIAGRLVLQTSRLPPGQFLAQGDLVAHVLPGGAPLVRALVRNQDIALVRDRPVSVAVQLAHGDGDWQPARLSGHVPKATLQLPSAALGEAAGGPVVQDSSDASGQTAREPHFQFDLQLAAGTTAHVGARVMVRFGHGQASVAALFARWARQAFLRHFAQ